MFKRSQKLAKRGKESCFLWGPRQTGKTTLLKELFPEARYYDLLLSDEFERFNRRPSLLREELSRIGTAVVGSAAVSPDLIIVDEVQKVPLLLDEIQWMMGNLGIQFILCGSSARKLKRGGGNLLGGRALRYELFPLVYKEIPQFDLLRALNHGLIPHHYLAEEPTKLIQAYVGDYLKEEIAAEGIARNIPAFGRFLEAAAFSNGSMVVYKNIASDCGIDVMTVKSYFEILTDTLLARFIPSYQKRPKRKVIKAPRFYFFDVGVTNFLLKRGTIADRSEAFGRAFEHFIFQELCAHTHYTGIDYPIAYWHTTSNLEVDFILGEHEIAIEVKGTEEAAPHDLKGLKAFREEYPPKQSILVSLDKRPRHVDGIDILPWQTFLDALWDGKIIS